jgi:predicted Zn-dependent peptidase
MQLLLHTLPNGIRIAHHRTNGMVAHCGLVIETGSRDEDASEHGMTHFIEHMLFKGTGRRKAYHILSRLDDVGGELNAYTTKEDTTIHASFLKEDFERALDLISDITFNSIFPAREIEKEKDVVIEEINSYLDNPGELIFDEFEEMVFAGQPLGRNILGTPSSVKSFTQENLNGFFQRNYNTRDIIFCSVGDIPDATLLRLAGKYLGNIEAKKTLKRAKYHWNYKPSSITRKKDTYQNHCIIGNVAYNLKDKRRLGMVILNNIIGGQGLNSRLNLSLREKNGLAYNVESGYNPYRDAGIFSIYFGTDRQNLENSISIVMVELNKLRTIRLGSLQLSKAKNQIKGYLARGYENHENLMLSFGKSLLVFGKIDTLEDICRKIEGITSSDLLEIANDVLDPKMLSTLIYK